VSPALAVTVPVEGEGLGDDGADGLCVAVAPATSSSAEAEAHYADVEVTGRSVGAYQVCEVLVCGGVSGFGLKITLVETIGFFVLVGAIGCLVDIRFVAAADIIQGTVAHLAVIYEHISSSWAQIRQ